MQDAQVDAERRRHARAHLRFPARVRWHGPLGMQLEITETMDISRGGILVRCREGSLAPGSRVWVVFPYETAVSAFEPETPALVVRAERGADGECRAGLRLELHRANDKCPADGERRALPRVALCLPIFVRTEGMPWPEEALTRDFSRGGMSFETPHFYDIGETVHAKIPWGEWAEMGEILGRVVRVEGGAAASSGDVSAAGQAFNCVAVQLADNG